MSASVKHVSILLYTPCIFPLHIVNSVYKRSPYVSPPILFDTTETLADGESGLKN